MAVGTIQIQLPIRAFWWAKKSGIRKGLTIEKWVEGLVLRELEADQRVDLTRSPSMEE